MSPTEAPIHMRARFDGRAFVPETSVDVAEGTVVELWGEPAQEKAPRRKAGSAKGLIEMREDFDDPIPEFATTHDVSPASGRQSPLPCKG